MSSDPEAIAALRAAAFLGVAGSAYGCFGALFRAQPRWLPTILAIETAWLAVQVPASWWLVAGGNGLSALVALAAVLQLAQIVTALALWRAVFGSGAPVFGRVAACRALLRRALPFAVSGLVANLHARAAALMLGALATPVDIGWFGAASRVARAVKLAPQAVFAGALPVLALEFGRDEASAARASATLDRALAMTSIGAAAICSVAAPLILRVVFGPSFAGAAPTLVCTAVGIVPALTNSARKVALFAAGREAVVVRWSTVALALQAVAAAALIPIFGSIGAALAIGIAEAAVWLPLRAALTGGAATPLPHKSLQTARP
jgi:O-antigen/teichoic acid export membrane protein